MYTPSLRHGADEAWEELLDDAEADNEKLAHLLEEDWWWQDYEAKQEDELFRVDDRLMQAVYDRQDWDDYTVDVDDDHLWADDTRNPLFEARGEYSNSTWRTPNVNVESLYFKRNNHSIKFGDYFDAR